MSKAPTISAYLHYSTILPLAKRIILLVCGLWVYALGLVFTLRSNLGLGPWDTFHQGLSRHLPLTIGQASIIVSVLIVVGSYFLGVRPGLGTLLNSFGIGIFFDLINDSPLLPHLSDSDIVLRLLFDALGVLIIGVGSALYLKPRLGAGPRDGLMLYIRDRFHVRVGVARACLEIVVLSCGFLLGGTVGIGSAIFALGVGPSVELGFRLLRVKGRQPAPAAETMG